jgi:hypothetical protein
LKQLPEAVGNTLEHTGIGNNFLNRNSKGSASKRNNEQMGLHKLKSFCTRKETVTRCKIQRTEWEKIFASYSSNKGLLSRIYR